jgi:hypothetical protein
MRIINVRDFAGDRGTHSDSSAGVLDSQLAGAQSPSGSVVCPTSIRQAAEGIVWTATAPELAATPGAFYVRHERQKLKGAATDPVLTAKVWA